MINVGSRSVRYLHGVPYPVVTFYWAMETFLRHLPGNQVLQVWGKKTYSWLRTDKNKQNKIKTKNQKTCLYFQQSTIENSMEQIFM